MQVHLLLLSKPWNRHPYRLPSVEEVFPTRKWSPSWGSRSRLMGPRGPFIETALFILPCRAEGEAPQVWLGQFPEKLPFIHSYPHKQSNACVQPIELWSRPSLIRLNTIWFTGCSPAARAKPFDCEMKGKCLLRLFFLYIQLNRSGFAYNPAECNRWSTSQYSLRNALPLQRPQTVLAMG